VKHLEKVMQSNPALQ